MSDLPELHSRIQCEKCGKLFTSDATAPHMEYKRLEYIEGAAENKTLTIEERIERTCRSCGYCWWEDIYRG